MDLRVPTEEGAAFGHRRPAEYPGHGEGPLTERTGEALSAYRVPSTTRTQRGRLHDASVLRVESATRGRGHDEVNRPTRMRTCIDRCKRQGPGRGPTRRSS
jgi:hypothetical protein